IGLHRPAGSSQGFCPTDRDPRGSAAGILYGRRLSSGLFDSQSKSTLYRDVRHTQGGEFQTHISGSLQRAAGIGEQLAACLKKIARAWLVLGTLFFAAQNLAAN